MSRWTHIAGAVRIDAFAFIHSDEVVEQAIRSILGVTPTFYGPADYWDLPPSQTTPVGSEGGISYRYLITAEHNSSLSRGVIAIAGDLRDFGTQDDINSILKWLNRLLSQDLFYIRQGIVQVIDEDNENSCIISYNEEKWEIHYFKEE